MKNEIKLIYYLNLLICSSDAHDYPFDKYLSSQSVSITNPSYLVRFYSKLLFVVKYKLFICIKVELYLEFRVFLRRDTSNNIFQKLYLLEI